MVTTARAKIMTGGLAVALAFLLLGAGSLLAQTSTPSTPGTPVNGAMDMDMASPAADAASMEQMMEDCMTMMGMMMQMMDMMGDGDMMGGMEDMPTTTPSS